MIYLTAMTEGERRSADVLYKSYKNDVYAVAYGILQNREDAEDSVCETFLRIMKDLKYFRSDDETAVKRLTVKYARWTAINLYNKRKRRASVTHQPWEDDGDVILALPDPDPPPDEVAQERDTAHAARRMIESLPLSYRDPLVMRYYHDMSIADIARLLGLTKSAVNMRLARAKSAIEKKLREEGYFNEA